MGNNLSSTEDARELVESGELISKLVEIYSQSLEVGLDERGATVSTALRSQRIDWQRFNGAVEILKKYDLDEKAAELTKLYESLLDMSKTYAGNKSPG
jgi:hypothetical protein